MHIASKYGLIFWMLLTLMLPWRSYAQRVDWQQIDENHAQFGFVGYQGARKNVAIDGAGNVISCAPFGNKVHAGSQEHSALFETLIVKRNAAGQVLWSRTLSGNGFKYGHSIHADSLGNIYLLGWYYGNSSINGNNLTNYGNYDCFLVKISASGQILYTKTFGSAGYDYPFALDTDATGNVWVAGKFAFSLQLGSSSLSGAANSHFLFKLNSSGTLVYLRNICQNGATDWGIGDLSKSQQGKIAVASAFVGTSSFQTKNLTGGGGYLAIINANTGDVDTVLKAGAHAWLVDHEPGGGMIVLGLQKTNTDSVGSKQLPSLSATNQLYLARVLVNNATDKVQVIPKQSGSFNANEGFRALHVNRAGQIFLSGELETEPYISPNKLLSLKLPHQTGRTQAVLAKLDENLTCSWFVGVGSRDTVGLANTNIGSGIFADPEGNIVWCTMNDAYSVVSTEMVLNSDSFNSGQLTSRYYAHGIHLWKFSEPSIRTMSPAKMAYCPGDSIYVNYQKFGQFSVGNRFRLELSDSSGSFVNPLLLKEISDTTSGTLGAVIPFLTQASGLYRVRVNGTMPTVFGSISDNPISVRGKPNADAGPNGYFCLGDTLRILATGGGSYKWRDRPDIIEKDSSVLIALPSAHGLYHVTVIDSVSSCYNEDSVSYFYREKVTLEDIKDTIACLGDTLIFHSKVLFGDSSRLVHVWKDANGAVLSLEDSLVLVAQSSMQIRLISWDSCSVLPDSIDFSIGLLPGLQVMCVSDTLVCSNIPVTLSATGTGGKSSQHRFTWTDATFQNVLRTSQQFDSLFQVGSFIGVKLTDGCSAQPDSLLIQIRVAPLPQLADIDSIMVCEADTVVLRVLTAGGYPGDFDFSWNNSPYTQSDSFVGVFAASSQVIVRVKDACGLLDNASAYVHVRVPLSLSIRPDTTLCLGEEYPLYVRGSELDTGHYSFFWDGESVARNYFGMKAKQTGYHHVRIRDNCDASERWDSVQIFVRDSLEVSLSIDTPFCYGERVLLEPTVTGGLPANYKLEWKELDGSLIGNFPSYSLEVRGDKDIWLVLHDACTLPSDSILLSLSTKAPLVIAPQADSLLCYEQFFRFVPTISGGNSLYYGYSISPLDSASLAAGLNITNEDEIEVIAYDGCSDSAFMKFSIFLRQPLQLSLLDDTAACEEESIRLVPIISGGILDQYVYSWQGIVSSSSEKSWNIEGDTTLVFQVDDGCSGSVRDSVFITAYSLPKPEFVLSDTQICAPDFVELTSLFASNSATWHWVSNALSLDTSLQVPSFRVFVEQVGSYLVGLQITDSNGCTSSFESNGLEAFPTPNSSFLMSDTVIDRDEWVEITAANGQSIQSEWFPSEVQHEGQNLYRYFPLDTGEVLIRHRATNAWGCTSEDSAWLRVKEPFLCFVPSAFHPDGLPENKLFMPLCEPWTEYSLMIYNRWGQLVFVSNDSKLGWDGTYMGGGEKLPSGAYVYLLRVKNEQNEFFQSKGTVTLIK